MREVLLPGTLLSFGNLFPHSVLPRYKGRSSVLPLLDVSCSVQDHGRSALSEWRWWRKGRGGVDEKGERMKRDEGGELVNMQNKNILLKSYLNNFLKRPHPVVETQIK